MRSGLAFLLLLGVVTDARSVVVRHDASSSSHDQPPQDVSRSLAESAHEVGRELAFAGTLALSQGSRKLARLFGNSKREAPSTAPDGYAPTNSTACPQNLVRQGGSPVSDAEQAWVTARRSAVIDAWRSYLNGSGNNSSSSSSSGNGSAKISGFNVNQFLSNATNVPTVAIANSGGGYRAMLHGAGIFRALDGRNDAANQQGTGGVVQLTTYMSGLSGGSWFVGSMAVNDFPTIDQLRDVWNLTENLVDPSGVIDDLVYYTDLHSEVSKKDDKGFDVSLTDYWGRALSRHLVNNSDHGLSTTFSSVQNLSSFTSHTMPFPIIIADSRAPGEVLIPVNTTIFEFNPYEFGSWNPGLKAHIPMQYLGTEAMNGQAVGDCVQGFDNAGFIMGTSATLFNVAIATLVDSSSTITALLGSVIQKLLGDDNDIAPYPNPFQGLNDGAFFGTNLDNLTLVDGGEDNENVPLWPLLVNEREVDVILAVDSSADTTFFWPNGSSLVQTNNRFSEPNYGSLAHWPKVPSDTNTFVNEGLNAHASFFGCNDTSPTPLIVYIPNAPYTAYTNFSTYQLDYSDEQVDAFLENAMHEAAENGTAISNGVPTFPTCLACALVRRGEQKQGLTQTADCQACFSAYCWNGQESSGAPDGNYEPQVPDVSASNDPGGAGTSQSPTPSVDGNAGLARMDVSLVGVILPLMASFVAVGVATVLM